MEQQHLFNNILMHSKTLGILIQKAAQLTQLNRTVLQKLDPSLRPHCRVTNLRDGILILTTTSPAFGHILRFSEIEILSTLRTDPKWCGLKSIQSKVRPLEPALDPLLNTGSKIADANIFTAHSKLNSKQSQCKIPSLSKTAAALIQTTASQIKCDRLRLSLQKLSLRHR